MIEPVDPGSPEARELIRELDAEIASRYPGLPIKGIDVASFESAGGYFSIPAFLGYVGSPISRCYAKRA